VVARLTQPLRQDAVHQQRQFPPHLKTHKDDML
jgi:hypothetical protein